MMAKTGGRKWNLSSDLRQAEAYMDIDSGRHRPGRKFLTLAGRT